MGNPKDIFKTYSPLTDKEMKDYLSGNLPEKDKRKIELKLEQDNFNKDALEGLASAPSGIAGFDSTKDEIFKSIDKKSSGWQFHHSIILAAILLITTMTVAPLLFPDAGQTSQTISPDTISPDDYDDMDTVAESNIIEIAELTDDEIQASIPLPEIELVKPQEIIITSPLVVDSVAIESDTTTVEEEVKKIIEIKKVDPQPAPAQIEVQVPDNIVYSNVPTFYMHQMLLVNYTKVYKEIPTITKMEVVSGTSAALENKDDQLDELHDTQIQTIEISYFDYLNNTQEYFAKEDFKTALMRYKTILKSYPKDLNAHFYSGLCYYNLGKYNLAHKHFEITQSHAFNTFKIDAEWYRAKTFYQQHKDEKCAEVLINIIDQNNYYSKKAQSLFDKIQ